MNRVLDKKDNNKLIRFKGNTKMILDFNNNLLQMINELGFRNITKSKLKYDSWIPNPNLGVIDTETCLDNDSNIQVVYALGFKSNLDDEPKIFYINEKTLNTNEIVLDMIDELLRPKYGS